ncbi:unnamed protein product [Rhizopus stolonifer]
MDEELPLRQRLALDNRAVKTLEKKVHTFLSTLYKEPIASAPVTKLSNKFERNPIIQKVNDKDIKGYDDIIERTVGSQSEAVKDIVTLKEDLIVAQDVRNHKLEYDRVARDIMELETRDTYKESIEDLKKEIEILRREKENKMVALDNRKKNLKQAVQNLKDLQSSMEEDRALMTDDRKKVMDMEKGCILSDDGEEFNSSDEEEERVSQEERAEQEKKHHIHRFQKRSSDDEDEEGMVLDTPML